MQELRLVAVSEDGSYLVLATAGRGTRFTLPIDDRLRAVVRGHFSRLGQYEIEVESPLRPKEIQARIRAGETAEEIAETAGIPVERVRWFEGPVLQEREYMAQQAQRVPIRRPGEPSPGPALGELVEERLGRRGVDLEEAEWDSRKCEDSTWRVSLAFYYDGRPYVAEWAYDPRRRHISAVNDEAARLSSLDLDESADDTVTPFVPRRAMKVVGDPAREQQFPPPAPIPAPRPRDASHPPVREAGRETGTTSASPAYPRTGEARTGAPDTGRPGTAPRTTAPEPTAPEPAAYEPTAYEPTAYGTTTGGTTPGTDARPAEQAGAAERADRQEAARDAGHGRTDEESAALRPDTSGPGEPPAQRAPHDAESTERTEHAARRPAAPGSEPTAPEPADTDAGTTPAADRPESSTSATRPSSTKPPAAPAGKPSAAKPSAAKPAASRPGAAKPAAPRPGARKPVPSTPVRDEPAQERPAARTSSEPAEPAQERPAAAAAGGAKPAAPPAAQEKRPPARKKARGKRASVPSWDEIMFGARRPE